MQMQKLNIKKIAASAVVFLFLYILAFTVVAIAFGEEVMAWRTSEEALHILVPAVLISGFATRWLVKFYRD